MQCPSCDAFYALSAVDRGNKSLIFPGNLAIRTLQQHKLERLSPTQCGSTVKKSNGNHQFTKFSPILLKCGHHVCWKCFKFAAKGYCCSICQEVTMLDEASDHKFILGHISVLLPVEMPTTLYSKAMHDLKMKDGPRHELCEECLSALYQLHCSDCKRNLCDACSKRIHNSNIFRNHSFEYMIDDYDHTIEECKDHTDELSNNICQTCNTNSEYMQDVPQLELELRSVLERIQEDTKVCFELLSAGALSADIVLKRISDYFVNLHGLLQLQHQNIKQYVATTAATYDYHINEAKFKLKEQLLKTENNLKLLEVTKLSELPDNVCLPVALQKMKTQLKTYHDFNLRSNDKVTDLLSCAENWWRVGFLPSFPAVVKVCSDVVSDLSETFQYETEKDRSTYRTSDFCINSPESAPTTSSPKRASSAQLSSEHQGLVSYFGSSWNNVYEEIEDRRKSCQDVRGSQGSSTSNSLNNECGTSVCEIYNKIPPPTLLSCNKTPKSNTGAIAKTYARETATLRSSPKTNERVTDTPKADERDVMDTPKASGRCAVDIVKADGEIMTTTKTEDCNEILRFTDLIKYKKSPMKDIPDEPRPLKPWKVSPKEDRICRSVGICLNGLRSQKNVKQAKQVIHCLENSSNILHSDEDDSPIYEPILKSDKPSVIRAKHSEQGFVVTSYVNPSLFYVVRLCDREKLDQLNTKINREDYDELPASDIKENMLCLAIFTNNGLLYRAVILKLQPADRTAQVIYVDFGNTEVVDVASLRKCPPLYRLESVPPFGIECSIFNVIPKNDEFWSLEAIICCRDLFVVNGSISMQLFINSVSASPNPKIPLVPKCQVDIICPCTMEECSYLPMSIREVLIFQEFAKDESTGTDVLTAEELTVQRCRKYFIMPLVKLSSDPINIKVTCVVSPSYFVVQINDYVDAWLELMRKIQICYNSMEVRQSLEYRLQLPKTGMVCVAQNLDDGRWYRAKVDKVEKKDSVMITFVDTGVRRNVECVTLRKIQDGFMKLPYQGIVCKLANLVPSEEEVWSRSCRYRFKKLLEEHESCLQAIFHNREEDVFEASIIVATVDEPENVAKALVEEGLAESSEKSLSTFREFQGRPSYDFLNAESSSGRSRSIKKLLPNRRCTQIVNQPESSLLQSSASQVIDGKGIIHAVNVLAVISPSLIFVQFVSYMKQFEELHNALVKEISNAKYSTFEKHKPNKPRVGCVCVAQMDISPYFTRAKVVSRTNEKCKVLLIDCGGFRELPKSALYPMPPDERFTSKPLSVAVALANIIPPCGRKNWPSSTLERLKDSMQDRTADLYMVRRGIPYSDEEVPNLKILPVELGVVQVEPAGPFEPNNTSYVSFNDILLDAGLALPKRTNSDKGLQNYTKFTSLESIPSSSSTETEKISCSKIDYTLLSSLNSCEVEGNIVSDPEEEISITSSLSSDPTLKEVSHDNERCCQALFKSAADSEATKLPKVSFPGVPMFPPPQALVDRQFKAEVTNVDMDAVLYLHPLAHKVTLQHMKDSHLLRFKDTTVTDKDMVWVVGDYVVARYHLDNSWYRARISKLGAAEPDDVEVVFIDYGNKEHVGIQDIRSENLFPRTPIQCYKCVLHDIVPVDPKGWTLSVLDFLHRYIVTSEVEVTVKVPHRQGDIAKVELKRLNDNPSGETFSDYLVNTMGFCMRGKLTAISKEDRPSCATDSSDVVVESDTEEENPACLLPIVLERSKKFITVGIAEVVDTSHIYLVPLSDLAEALEITVFSAYMTRIKKLYDRFEKEIAETDRQFARVSDPEVGNVYLCFSNGDNIWCRACLSKLEQSTAYLMCIDTAKQITVHENLLYKVPDSGRSIPGLAVPVILKGVTPPEGGKEWSEGSVQAMRECICDTEETIYAKVEGNNSENIPEVSLFFKDKDGFQYLCYQELIDTHVIHVK